MTREAFEDILRITNSGESEVGGGHAQKGFEFQRHWAVLKMFELKENENDFLFLFEAIQDISILDSPVNPESIGIFQVKKKDRNEWSWNNLTNLNIPVDPDKSQAKKKNIGKTKEPRKPKAIEGINESPIGKLYAAGYAIKHLKASCRFISNAGSNLPLATGGLFATSEPASLSDLPPNYLSLLIAGLKTLHGEEELDPNLNQIIIERVDIPPNDPGTYARGKIYDYLQSKSPMHSNQASALLDALLGQISPLGAKTDKCHTFEQLRKQRGYSKDEFIKALGHLEELPDAMQYLTSWTDRLNREGMGLFTTMGIHSSAASFYRKQVMGLQAKQNQEIILECEHILSTEPPPITLLPFFNKAHDLLKSKFPDVKKSDLLAMFALKAINQCVDLK